MRSQKSRSRNKSNRNSNRSMGNVTNRVFDSSGPEGKVRGTPQQVIEKYNQLARDAQLSGDRVATENFQQHAEHYLRLLGAAQKEQDARREEQERQNRERQAERDRERSDRQERDGNPADDGNADQPQGGSEPKDGDSNLVETPENKADAPKRARKPRRKPKQDGDPDASDENGQDKQDDKGASPEAAE
ncbi:DUF4167 domain-containing protein [Roseovarius sp. SCSIO 43702]|uniref:DUF4167 domain-containing protein n=1 Tax=Roseovarius sp. SCSIO 43702 TaxID=2823043 RepID=UPI001C73C72E|nr:DUF4167 domain-containing protein [Roseovarius sp. SCSIO 43702]QYX58349.1 DUF4167 domain-containing protein [Roseovarius sp. SCSIO 43702]